MQAVVLVKQVPDVRAGKVGVHPDGTIDRSSAAAITNPADLHAVEAALTVADHVVAVSMGPRTAEHALREALAIGADQAILLSDRAFAGSDTWATAHVLAAAVSRLEVDLILCGVSALDGETGQVGPQVAERLGVPQATYAEHLEVAGNELTVRRIIEGGYETVVMPLPALVTVAETGYLPRYPTLPGRQRARNAEIAVWAAADIGLGEADAGLAASPTKVAHMEAVPLAAADCRWVGEALTIEGLARALVDSGALSARVHAPMVADALRSKVTPPAGDPAVWVVCESDGGDLTRGSAELLSKAVELSPMLGGPVAAVVIGDDVGGVAATAARYGAEVVLVAEDPRLTPYRCLTHTRVLVDAIRSREPAAVLFSATTTGRDLAPRVAARIGAGLAADCTDLFVDDWDRGAPIFRHAHFGIVGEVAGVLPALTEAFRAARGE
jgi:electron transfer flavoprotein alpha subunit